MKMIVHRNERPTESVRHIITLEDRASLLVLPRYNWQYSVDENAGNNFNIDDKADMERELISNFLENIKICQKFA